MRRFRQLARIATLAALALLTVPAASNTIDTPPRTNPVTAEMALADLKSVGAATLRVFFWDVYDSELFSRDGKYRGIEPGLALNLKYKRAVTDEQLIKATQKEWKKLGGSQPAASEAWLERLLELWPDVTINDEILLYVDNELASHFYFNGTKLGVLEDSGFTEQFLAIWLSPETSHPRARAKLLNLSSNEVQ